MPTFRQLEEALDRIDATKPFENHQWGRDTVTIHEFTCDELDVIVWAAKEYWNECAQGSALDKKKTDKE